jgi:Domain of unknown function (DUF4381)
VRALPLGAALSCAVVARRATAQVSAAPSREAMHDLLLPPPIPLWPATPAWAVLGAVVLAALLWLAWRGLRAWRRDAYRREALRALAVAEAPAEVSAILKRTALAAWPRAQVAALSGAGWAAFLRRTAPRARLDEATARRLADLAYAPAAPVPREAAHAWVRHHRPGS